MIITVFNSCPNAIRGYAPKHISNINLDPITVTELLEEHQEASISYKADVLDNLPLAVMILERSLVIYNVT